MGYIFTQYSNKSGVDVSVVQSTGTSKVDVMSQDATTRELNSVKQAINKSASALLELQNGIITPVGSFQTDSSVAYVKDVPENALPRAELKKVGGITKKTGSSTNLLPYPYPSNASTIAGVTFTDSGDGSIKVSGTAEDYVIYVLATEGSVNFGNRNMSAGISFGDGDGYVLSGGTDHVIIQYFAETRECLLTVAEGVTVDDEVVYPMVNTGLFPETWEPYKAPTLYTAKVTEVESAGANLLNQNKIVAYNGCEIRSDGDELLVTPSNTDPFWFYKQAGGDSSIDLTVGRYYCYCETDGGAFVELRINGGTVLYNKGYFEIPKDMESLHFELEGGVLGRTYKVKLAIYKVQKDEYTPYLHHTLPIPVEVRGSENLIPYPYEFSEINENGITGRIDADQKIIINGTATVEFSKRVAQFTLPKGTYTLSAVQPNAYTRVYFYKNGTLIKSQSNTDEPFTFTSENESDEYTAYIVILTGVTFTNGIWVVMINEGPIALPYEPYSAVKGLDGYGLGISDTVYNYIDWEKKQFVKRCAMVDLGTLEWTLGSVFYASIGWKKGDYNLLSAPYPVYVGGVSDMPDKSMTINTEYGDLLYIKDTSYTDAASFKTAMSGVMLVYELATPEVTDISQYITDDDVNIMKVGASGTITFKNGYAEAVPSEIEYQVGA